MVLVDRARRLELLGKHVRINAFSERVTVGVDTPLQELFKQISGHVIRPAGEGARLIDHDGATDAQAEAIQRSSPGFERLAPPDDEEE